MPEERADAAHRAEENERLADKIEMIHEESPDKGYRRLNDELGDDHRLRLPARRIKVRSIVISSLVAIMYDSTDRMERFIQSVSGAKQQ